MGELLLRVPSAFNLGLRIRAALGSTSEHHQGTEVREKETETEEVFVSSRGLVSSSSTTGVAVSVVRVLGSQCYWKREKKRHDIHGHRYRAIDTDTLPHGRSIRGNLHFCLALLELSLEVFLHLNKLCLLLLLKSTQLFSMSVS